MKTMKKIMAVLLAAIMTLAMAVTAFAAEGTKGTITVKVKDGQNLAGQTVNFYKLFDMTVSGSGDNVKYGYKVNSDYTAILDQILTVSSKTDEGYYEAVQTATTDGDNGVNTNTQKFANDFTEKLLEANKTATPKIAATQTKSFAKDSTATSFTSDDLDYGYYLVCQTGTKAIQSSLVPLVGTTAEVNLKSEAPSIEKTTNDNKKSESVQIGDTITYKITGVIPDRTGYTTYVYKIHDELSEGLDFVGTTASVQIGDAAAETVTVTKDADNANKITVDLSSYVTEDNANAGKTVTVTYQAKVNSKANVGTVNNAELEYSNNPSDENSKTTTPPSKVTTPTYPLNIKKTDSTTAKNLLAGAKFRLYTNASDANADNGNNTIKVAAVQGTDGKYTVLEDQATGSDEMISVASVFSEDEDYNLQLNGLKEGTYYLVETEAPDGYNKLAAPVEVKITKSTTTDETAWTMTKNGADETDKIIDIENSTGSLLPSTGGKGAIAFAVVAAVLVFGVAVSFVRDRRRA